MQPFVLGLDIGGTSLKLGAWAVADGKLDERLAWRDGLDVPDSSDSKTVCAAIAALLREFAAELRDDPLALGIGSCGLISDGIILQSPNTPWDYLPLRPELRERLGWPVELINDADAFLLGALAQHGKLPVGAIGITLGTGIGTAVWLHGRLLAGGSGISPEGGHITLALDREPANTGIPGSWELLAARDALLGYFSEQGGAAELSALDIAQLAEAGDAAAQAAWRRYGHCVGAGLGSLVNLFSPQLIVIGGGLAGARAHYDQALRAALKLHKLAAMPLPAITYLDEAPDTVALGGAWHALRNLSSL